MNSKLPIMGPFSKVYVGTYALIYQNIILGEGIVSRDGLPRGVLPSGILPFSSKSNCHPRMNLNHIFISYALPLLSPMAKPTEPVTMQHTNIPNNETSNSVFRPKRVNRKVVSNVTTIVIIPTMTVPIFGFSISADSNMLVE